MILICGGGGLGVHAATLPHREGPRQVDNALVKQASELEAEADGGGSFRLLRDRPRYVLAAHFCCVPHPQIAHFTEGLDGLQLTDCCGSPKRF